MEQVKKQDRLDQHGATGKTGTGLSHRPEWSSMDLVEQQEKGCRLFAEDAIGYSQAGEITLGGLFSVHMGVFAPSVTYRESPKPLQCVRFHIRYYRFLLAMVYAVMEINASGDLLPNITLGFILYDSCYNEVRSLIGTRWILSGKINAPNFDCNKHNIPLAIIGDMPSKASVPVARILGLYRYPQVSYASGTPLLSDKIQFPSFLRTLNNGDYEGYAIGKLLQYFNWTWVGIIFSDNDLGRAGLQMITKGLESYGGCTEFQEILPIVPSMESVFRIINVVKKSKD
ncbi:extracellular calcium-sensing receptor-like [Xenopus tropicalis]|uniref:Extracellular calcium-sensing receptor-like n=1 Tax=Xenopus tropicalis TaxID=8364 RepID=A0A8J1IPV2_XENTR|nr:extracellular calcium-sensing receptor-like [Xenopus tropicalis]